MEEMNRIRTQHFNDLAMSDPFRTTITTSSSRFPDATMFRATENPSVGEMNSLGEATFGRKFPGWVTDGPQMFRTQTGKLEMLWSGWVKERYLLLVCYSESGTIAGHGMLFRTFEGKLVLLDQIILEK